MKLETFVKTHYQQIKQKVNGKAFHSYIDASDLLSMVNLKLSLAIYYKTFEGKDDDQFFAFFQVLLRNCVLEHQRIAYNRHMQDSVSLEDAEYVRSDNNLTFEFKDFLKLVSADTFPRKKHIGDIFKVHFLQGVSEYAEVSKVLDIPERKVKSRVYELKQYMISKYGKVYKELI